MTASDQKPELRLTAEQFAGGAADELGDVEIVDGRVIRSMAHSPTHSRVVRRLAGQLEAARRAGEPCMIVDSDVAVPGAPAELTERFFGTDRLTNHPSFAYRFDWSPPGSPFGACHCIELPFVFGGLDAWRAAPMLAGAELADLRRLTTEVQTAWARFVHDGEPGWPASPHVRHFT